MAGWLLKGTLKHNIYIYFFFFKQKTAYELRLSLVGSVAIAILANLGYEVAAVTGRPEASDYLKALGATQIVARSDINETTKRPLEAETWSGCVDAVGGDM